MSDQADTIVELFCRRIDTDGDRPALAIKQQGAFQWRTWNEIAAEVAKTVAALVNLGVRPGDRVAHLSENRYEWVIADLAIQMAGAIHVPIHAPLTGVQVAWQIRHSGAKVALLSGPGQAAKLAALAQRAPRGLTWVSFDRCSETIAGQIVAVLSDVQSQAEMAPGIEAACRTRKEITAQSLATILYTSGTTGEPKGVMLTQGNLATNCLATIDAFGFEPEDVRLNFLPLSHIFARTCDLYCWVAGSARLALAESRESVIADCHLVHPTVLNGVPHFYDRVYRGLCEKKLEATPGAARAALGGAVRVLCAGGAALPDHLFDFFQNQGVPVLQGYGLTESSPVITLSSLKAYRRGSCGRAIPGVEVKLAADGEILTRGPHVMTGYYENPAATAEVLKDGWLYTGDLGRLDEEGFLYITGRKKEILVTLGGKNIAPVYLESLLTQDPLILQALVVGDGRPFLSALVVPNEQQVQVELAARGIAATPEAAPQVLALFRERIAERLKDVSHYEQVQQFVLLPRAFSIEAGEMTAKLSLRRREIEAHFADDIAAMYRPVKLLVSQKGKQPQWIEVKDNPCLIGRSPTCQIVLPDAFVGRQHCRIVRYGGVFVVEDLKSPNGTHVNYERVPEKGCVLNDGDRIEIGDYRLSLVLDQQSAPCAAAATTSAKGSSGLLGGDPNLSAGTKPGSDAIAEEATSEAPGPGLVPAKKTEVSTDSVDCTLFAPQQMNVGDTILVQAALHLPERAGEAAALAQEFDAQAVRRGHSALGSGIALGSRVMLDLRVPGMEVDEPMQTVIWQGQSQLVSFAVTAHQAAYPQRNVGTLQVSVNGVPAGRIKFALQVGPAAAVPQQRQSLERYRRAFISYSAQDRDEVLKRVQMLRQMQVEVFQDVLSLAPGQQWEQELYRRIDECDLFLLFWSSAAKTSEWVQKEVHYALGRQQLLPEQKPEIVPVILEGPPVPMPFDEIKHLHFNDQVLCFLGR
jgi:long-chain acyl-CoA synthetase